MEEKHKLLPGSEIRKMYLVKKNRGYKKWPKNFHNDFLCLPMIYASNKIAFVLAKEDKPFSDGEDNAKQCLNKIRKWVGD